MPTATELRAEEEAAALRAENVVLLDWHNSFGREFAELVFAVEELGQRLDRMENVAAV